MNLLLFILVVSYVTASRSRGSTPLIRTPYLIVICCVLAVAYLSQRVV